MAFNGFMFTLQVMKIITLVQYVFWEEKISGWTGINLTYVVSPDRVV
jgi:hypothetical protein